MKKLKRYTIIGILFVLTAGTFAHFLYDWSHHNYVVGLFTPVNESIWEHMKLLFFPMLIYSLFMIFMLKDQYPSLPSALCFGILSGTFLIPVLYYTYTAILGKDFFVLDIAVFILSTVLAFWLSYRLGLSDKRKPRTFLSCILVFLLLVCFLIFTYHPPTIAIFQDPTVSRP